MWDGRHVVAAALVTPMRFIDALSVPETQIIPLRLVAAAGMLETYGEQMRGRDVLFFIDNQSVCCALVNKKRKQQVLGHPAAINILAAD